MYTGTILYRVPECDIIDSCRCPVPQRIPCKSVQWSLDTKIKTPTQTEIPSSIPLNIITPITSTSDYTHTPVKYTLQFNHHISASSPNQLHRPTHISQTHDQVASKHTPRIISIPQINTSTIEAKTISINTLH
ncbi:uncharacterized protein DC041_0012335 [Schistosoma bovis]|uniref:Uncharacterized protein n=1 Tax=Schistosoma bovis TaxID=6184 RepID=A0A430QLK1_SCHBO|nr:uncharacterized protein DC041_0012323 [Schistosoma bovis]RTG88530.1 uncharacterized protein DC041_0012326 [Schistosoma bovis]RTG88532.1 uncharacterized protein DC041_0012327 [Schistosoma bovis]RTG88534.1 uncharacterized protein DC041_0012334 [Schistosoma bovis]RTG88535.1 uncharacterized protein DC041_0012335 [Schistosoma bovis]